MTDNMVLSLLSLGVAIGGGCIGHLYHLLWQVQDKLRHDTTNAIESLRKEIWDDRERQNEARVVIVGTMCTRQDLDKGIDRMLAEVDRRLRGCGGREGD